MIFKRITAIMLSFLLVIAPFQTFASEVAVPEAKVSAISETHIPLKNAVDISGATLTTEGEYLIVEYRGSRFTYKLNTTEGTKNGVAVTLTEKAIIEDGVMYVSYDDASYLFRDSNDKYPNTVKNLVITAYTYMRLYDVPSISLAITDPEKDFSWKRSFGYSDIEKGKLANTNDVYNLASISKVFTAVSIFQLVEQGKIDLNQKVSYYLPELNIPPHPVYGGNYKDITVRMLLSHTSGLPSDNFADFYTKDSYNQNYMNDFINQINSQCMDNKPLERWYYANNGYVALGIIIARVTGNDNYFQGYSDYVNTNIINKLGMENTTFVMNEKTLSNLAAPYITGSTGKQGYNLQVNAISAGGLYSNSGDMINFMNMLLNNGTHKNNKIISANNLKLMTDTANYDMSLNPQIDMGLGMYSTNLAGIRMVGHGGDVANYHSDMQISLENKIGLFATGNSQTSMFVSSLLTSFGMKWAVDEKTGVEHVIPEPLKTEDVKISAEQLSKNTGYFTGLGKISATEKGTLMIDKVGLEITPQKDGTFYSPALGRVTFGNVDGLDVIYLGDQKNLLLGERIEPIKADESFKKLVGEYSQAEVRANSAPIIEKMSIYVTEDGYPAFSFNVNDTSATSDMILGKIDDNTYYILGSARNYGKLIKVYEENGNRYLEAYGIKAIMKKQ